MGQGTLTGLAQLVAEELECDWKKVTTESITPGQNLARKRVWGEMGTGGSRGIRTSQDYVRRGGAAARVMLLQAAADRVERPGRRGQRDRRRHHARAPPGAGRATARSRTAAAKLTAPDPASITLKDPKDWKIAGKPMKRLDTADKLNGSKVYAIDLTLPGMLHAAVKACPVFGGKLVSYDEAKVTGRPGVRRVVKVNDATVAVVADTWWRAKTALDALPIVWRRRRRRLAVERDDRRASRRGAHGQGCVRVPQRRRRPRGDPGRREEGRGRLQHAVPGPRHDGADELHGEALGGPGRVLGADAELRGVAGRAVRAVGHPARRSARSTGTTSAVASAGAAATRTTCARPCSSPSSFPTSRSSWSGRAKRTWGTTSTGRSRSAS